jgi:hypothetical protein
MTPINPIKPDPHAMCKSKDEFIIFLNGGNQSILNQDQEEVPNGENRKIE